MGKKNKKKEENQIKFDKFSKKIVKKIEDRFKTDPKSGAVVLLKNREKGLTFIDGDTDSLFTVLRQSCLQDPNFSNLLSKVVNSLGDEKSKENRISFFGKDISEEQLKNMSPRDIDSFLDNAIGGSSDD